MDKDKNNCDNNNYNKYYKLNYKKIKKKTFFRLFVIFKRENCSYKSKNNTNNELNNKNLKTKQ